MNKVFLAEGYLDDDLNILNPHRFRRLFSCLLSLLEAFSWHIRICTQLSNMWSKILCL
jgi:hypothetical protein